MSSNNNKEDVNEEVKQNSIRPSDIDDEVANILYNNAAISSQSTGEFESSSSPQAIHLKEKTLSKTKTPISSEFDEYDETNTNDKLENKSSKIEKENEEKVEKAHSSPDNSRFVERINELQSTSQKRKPTQTENLSTIDVVPVESKRENFKNAFSNIILPSKKDESFEASKEPSVFGFNKNYVKSIAGLLRLILILFYFAAWVSLACVSQTFHGKVTNIDELIKNYGVVGNIEANQDIRSAFLFFTVAGFVGSLLLYILIATNLVHNRALKGLPWTLITFLSNVIWILPVFILSIFCAAKESDLRNLNYNLNKVTSVYFESYNTDIFQYIFNIGSYASAAFFGFLTTIILGIDSVLHGIRLQGNLNVNYPFYV